MQAITPIDVHVENEWRDDSTEGLYAKKNTKTSTRGNRQGSRMRTRVVNKTKTKKTQPSSSPLSHIPKQVVIPKLVLPGRSRSPSPSRGPWYEEMNQNFLNLFDII
jgi:hypothetical protein